MFPSVLKVCKFLQPQIEKTKPFKCKKENILTDNKYFHLSELTALTTPCETTNTKQLCWVQNHHYRHKLNVPTDLNF